MILFDVVYRTAGIVDMIAYKTINDLEAVRVDRTYALVTPNDVVLDALIELRHLGAWFDIKLDEKDNMTFIPIPRCNILEVPDG